MPALIDVIIPKKGKVYHRLQFFQTIARSMCNETYGTRNLSRRCWDIWEWLLNNRSVSVSQIDRTFIARNRWGYRKNLLGNLLWAYSIGHDSKVLLFERFNAADLNWPVLKVRYKKKLISWSLFLQFMTTKPPALPLPVWIRKRSKSMGNSGRFCSRFAFFKSQCSNNRFTSKLKQSIR